MDDDAVSPVIGVILMVAVTVVLAAVVFVLVQGLGADRPVAHGLAVLLDEGDDQLLIAGANSVDNWENYEMRSSEAVAGLHWVIDAEATSSDAVLSSTFVALSGGSLRAGSAIDFCAETPLADVDVLIRDANANTVVYRGHFRSIAAC